METPVIGDLVILGGEPCIVIKKQGSDFVARTKNGALKGFDKNTPFSIVTRKAEQEIQATVAQPSAEEVEKVDSETSTVDETSSADLSNEEPKDSKPKPEKELSFLEKLFAKKKD